MKKLYVTLAIVLVVVLLVFLFMRVNWKASSVNSAALAEKFTNYPPATSVADIAPVFPDAATGGVGQFAGGEPTGNEVYSPVASSGAAGGAGSPIPSCYPRDRLSADDLLPKDAADSRWAQMNPAGQGDISNVNFLTAGYQIGVDTVGSSKKNGNLQLRSDPPAPQVVVSPWMQSTIEPSDINRRPLEIGGEY
ncbi:hypothetical protein [Dishui Lake large algae virus 1]|nr:hypothetical protein [Dishui Lake large algae virus 1]